MGADPSPLPLPPAAALQEEAAALGKSSFAFAFYMDRQKEERERGVTISCTTKEFFTEKFHYTIIDAPGERRCLGLLPGAGVGEHQGTAAAGRQAGSAVETGNALQTERTRPQSALPGMLTRPPCPPIPTLPAAPQAIAISSRT